MYLFMTHRLLLCVSLLIALPLSTSAQTPGAPVVVSAPLVMVGADGKDHSPLVVPAGKKAAVLCFVSPYCPTSNKLLPEFNDLAEQQGGSFAFYVVHADPEVKLPDVLQHIEMLQVKATVLLDKEQKLTTQLGASITPEVAVISPEGKALYQGRINDLYLGPTKKQRKATTHDLKDALEAVLQGKAPAVAKTEAMGCKITMKK